MTAKDTATLILILIVILVALMVVVLSIGRQQPVYQDQTVVYHDKYGRKIYRYVDPETNVACYYTSDSISCVHLPVMDMPRDDGNN